MKEHPKENQIISAVCSEGLVDERRVLEHVANCETCRVLYGDLLNVLGPGKDRDIAPPPRVLNRIRASYTKISSEKKPAGRYREPAAGTRFRPAVYGLVSLCAIILVSVFLLNHLQQADGEIIELMVSRTSGSVDQDGTPVTGRRSIKPAMSLSIGGKSAANISYKDLCYISLMENSSFRVDNSIYNSKTMKYFFAFHLDKGKLSGKFKKLPGRLEYAFVTPHARIESIGTSFTIEASKNVTVVTVLQGKLRISCLASGEERVTSGQHSYIIGKSIQVKDISGLKNEDSRNRHSNIIREKNEREIKKTTGPEDDGRIEKDLYRRDMKRNMKEGERELRRDRRSMKGGKKELRRGR